MGKIKSNVNSKNKSNKINNLRVIAIILVVLGHSIIIYSSSWNLYQTSNKVIFLDYFKKNNRYYSYAIILCYLRISFLLLT